MEERCDPLCISLLLLDCTMGLPVYCRPIRSMMKPRETLQESKLIVLITPNWNFACIFENFDLGCTMYLWGK